MDTPRLRLETGAAIDLGDGDGLAPLFSRARRATVCLAASWRRSTKPGDGSTPLHGVRIGPPQDRLKAQAGRHGQRGPFRSQGREENQRERISDTPRLFVQGQSFPLFGC